MNLLSSKRCYPKIISTIATRRQPSLKTYRYLSAKRRAKNDFKGRHFEPWLIIQAVSWCLRYPLSCRDVESLFAERGFDVDHSTINRWVLAYARDREAPAPVPAELCRKVGDDGVKKAA
jgi:hypothetical protein